MRRFTLPSLALLAVAAMSAPTRAQTSDSSLEFGFMPKTRTVTLLNDGGKYVAIDLKHIAKGETCRMDEGATIVRVGQGENGMIRVRYAAGQTKSGGCPFMTTFDLPEAEYAQAHASFEAKKDEAWKKIDEIKKDLGKKWDELFGSKG
ncbi:MAG TPA: hypothetical protein VFZ16_16735 [Hyphomicrobiaceae bacterium]|nr:hypothetical protein [Hyphomicrobiaceae bacterium]